jgi:protein-tyrosine phosphatase
MSDSTCRHLNLAGASNFRDLGGYRAQGRPTVRWRQIFRSNHLGHLTEADIAVLRRLGLKSAFDFRGTEERVAAMCGLAEIAVHSLPIEPTVVRRCARAAAGGCRCHRNDARRGDAGFLPQLCAPEHAELSARCSLICRGPRAAGDSLHRRQGSHRFRLRADPASLGVARRSDCGGLSADQPLLPARSASSDLPEEVRQVLGVGGSFLPRRGFEAISADMAISKAISATAWASALGNAQRSRRATWMPKSASPPGA